jgi:very-short-patch-repair endonuclease
MPIRNKCAPWKFEEARRMRLAPTEAEAHLWSYLRRQALGVKFRRQIVMYGYIVDFYCPSRQLVVEVDGPIHVAASDRARDAILAQHGLTVLRFSNDDVMARTDLVLERISSHMAS